jgi:biotin transport system substrate-specific component
MVTDRLLRLCGARFGNRGGAWEGWSRALVGPSMLAVMTAMGARIVLWLPTTPVPMTLQVLPVLLSGLLLGGRRGALSQMLYLIAGLAGLPVFASAAGLSAFLGPAGGYLLAFPLVAYCVGTISRRFGNLLGYLLATTSGVMVLYAGGTLWLASWWGAVEGWWLTRDSTQATNSLVSAWRMGVMPFVLVDLGKAALSALIGDRLSGLTCPQSQEGESE